MRKGFSEWKLFLSLNIRMPLPVVSPTTATTRKHTIYILMNIHLFIKYIQYYAK